MNEVQIALRGNLDPNVLCEATKEIFGPDLRKGSHFIPSVHINHVELKRQERFGVPIYVPQPPVPDMQKRRTKAEVQESTSRADKVRQVVLTALRIITEAEPQDMHIVSELKYEDYLNHHFPALSASATRVKLRIPHDLTDIKLHRGDFDVLVLHHKRWFLDIEIKAIGDMFEPGKESEKDGDVLKKLGQSIRQLGKGKEVLEYVTADRPVPVFNAVALPNISRQQLGRILDDNPQIRSDLCLCLGVDPSEDPLDYCLLKDLLPQDAEGPVSGEVTKKLLRWWHFLVQRVKPGPALTEDEYTELVARWCGPASFPSPSSDDQSQGKIPCCRTVGEAAAVIGDLYSKIVLYQDQQDILNTSGNLTFLSGPPGAGKTVLLVLKAMEWLKAKKPKPVHIVSTWSGSLAASHHIASALRGLLRHISLNDDLVTFHHFDLKEDGEEPAVTTLLEAAGTGPLCLICDEAYGSSEFSAMCSQLIKEKQDLCLWAASVYHGHRPDCLEDARLFQALRTPPVVTREVLRSELFEQGFVRKYCTPKSTIPERSGSLPLIPIYHNGPDHSSQWAGECQKCGELLADKLKNVCGCRSLPPLQPLDDLPEQLCVTPTTATSRDPLLKSLTENDTTDITPVPFRDVFILTTNYDLEDGADHSDEEDGNVSDDSGLGSQNKPASGLIRGLRKSGVPCRVVAKGNSKALREVSVMAGEDAVVAADADTIRGLERRIVVWVPFDRENDQAGEEGFGRLDVMSRTTAQLILIV